ncbi:MAG: hypothetical protein ACE37F_01495 [Nannocystaceae bacterium]|nr:hypothetical protein [bacterium]
MSLTVTLDTRTVRVARLGGLVLCDSVGWRSGDPDFNPHVVDAVGEVVTSHATVQLLARSLRTHPPTQEGRAAYKRMFSEHGKKITVVHFAIEDSGFVASAMRSAVSTLATLGMTGAPLHVHKDIELALDAMCRAHPEHGAGREAILEFYRSHPAVG